MPKKSKLNLPPLDLGEEKLNERLARLRKERGYTQAELAKTIGITRDLVSDYERGKIRPHFEMIIRFSFAFKVTSDELLGINQAKFKTDIPSLKIQRRMKKIANLPDNQQKFILKTIDSHLKALEK